jgi:PAS domain S-box-containing protein
MQAIYKRASVLTGFLILAFLLLANAWVTNRQLEGQLQNHALLIHTEKILLELSETGLLLDEAETGQRGYLYTGRQEYLSPYTEAISEMDRHLQELSRLEADDPTQLQRAAQLGQLAHEKLDELSQTISLYRAGKPDLTRGLVLTGRGKATMDAIRTLIEAMQRAENEKEEAGTAQYSQSVWRTRASLFLATVLGVVASALLAHYILRQMDLRERHAAQMREREEWYRVTLTSIGDAVIATDAKGLVTFLNSTAEQLTGRAFPFARGKTIHDVFPIFNEYSFEVAENPVKTVMALGKVIGLANHTVLKHTSGKLTPIEDSAAPIRDDQGNLIGVVLVFRDATHERKSQEIVRKAEKLAAAARLASTFAHEINNPLDAVGNLVYLAKSVPESPLEARKYLAEAEEQLERVAHMARQTLGFYRESTKWQPVDLVAIVESALALYSNKLSAKNATVLRSFGDCPAFEGSTGELKQVAANLISNAADAIGLNGKISITITAVNGAAGQHVEFTVEDDGPGVAPENRERIFEPFFTTKEDVGTGLGLWVTKGILERHGGTIEVESSRNGLNGAAFKVSLPVTDLSTSQPDSLSSE